MAHTPDLPHFFEENINLEGLFDILSPKNNLVLADDMMLSDADGIILRVSENYERNFGFTHDSIVGKSAFDLEANGTFRPCITAEVIRQKKKITATQTIGYVSGINREVSTSSGVTTISMIQTDAAINPGNSGGPLFNEYGEVVGIVSAKYSSYASQSVEGLGFAIPINDAIKVAQDLLENGYVSGRPYMGITYLAVTDAQTAAQLNVNAYGVYVVDVVQGGPADKAGLKTGDRIVSIDGTEIAQKDDLGTLIQQHAAGDTLSITVAREGQMQTVSLTLGEKNAQTQQAQKNS